MSQIKSIYGDPDQINGLANALLRDGWNLLQVIPLIHKGTTTNKRELWFVKP